ncbi:Ig-like domain-containing protein [Pseudomonas triticicola]|uniref:Ig-like domain-containing protein n=1 Tax=Pseudomonas triticicola TaxID=2842345 RepID=UPI003EBA1450
MPSHKNFRFPPVKEGNDILALRPLLIPGMEEPVQDGDGGLNIQVATDDPEGLMCVINPYLPLMSEGDRLDIWWNNEKVLERFVTADEVDQRVFFYLPTPAESGWVENCHYVLTRMGETEADPPSASLRIMIKLYKPGNIDREPHKEDGHSELNIVQLPPELVEQGVIDSEWAKDGVLATIPHYVYCTRNDKVRLLIGDHLLPAHLITQEQAENRQPIEILIEQADILRAGDGLQREIRYDINDEVWNWADRHSKRTYIDIDAGGWRLEPPLIKEAINGVITIRDLNKLPVTVQIHVSSQYFSIGDSVKMTFIGRPPGNVEPITCSETREIDNVPSVLEIKVPYDLIRAIVLGRADVSHILYKKDGSDPLSSKRAFATVVGDVNMLPEPNILELIGDTLEPDLFYATVEVRYAMKNGDLICLRWSGTQSNGDEYLHEVPHIVSANEATAGLVTFYIDAEHITVLDNGTLDLSYVVANDAPGLLDVRESERLLVKVEKVRATLPRPEVEEAEPPGNVLDPSKVFDSVNVLIAEAKTLDKDVLTYYWRSPNPFSSTSDWLPITTVSAGKPVRFRVDKEYVTANIGQYVDVRYVLWRAASQRYEYSATLALLIGELVGELPPPDVLQAVGGVLNPMDGLKGVNVTASYLSMNPDQDLIRLRWLGVPGAGTSDDLELPGHESGTVQYHLPASIVGANIAKRVSVYYDVTRYTITTPSDMFGLYISDFENPENDLPRPRIPQAKDDILDLMEFIGDAIALLATWPFIAEKQCIWFFIDGITTAGQGYRIRILDGVEITAAQISAGLDEVLRRSELMKLGHSTAASVGCKVTFDGSRDENSAIEFPRRPLTVRTRYDYVTSVIKLVEDVRGEIEEGGKTRADEVVISGTATRGETIELFDAGSTSKGTAPVKDDSTWRATISTPTEKLYSITAKALYDADPVTSGPRTFTVKFTQTPEILSLTDSRGPVAPGAITYDNSVLVMGSATPNLQIELREDNQPIATLDVDDDGHWEHRINNLKVGDYSLVATAKYEVDPPSSPARTFKVAQAVTPTISSVSDLRGEITPGGTTYYRSVALTGKASPNETITLLDTTTVINTVAVTVSGDWQYTFSGLDLKGYSLTARAEYGSEPVSAPPRVFNVENHVSPTITSIKDSVGEVAQDQTTYDTTVNLAGTGTPREQIQLYDKGAVVGSPVTVDGNKQWKASVGSLAIASHSLTAKALYDVTPVESPERVFNVAAHIAPTLTSVHDGISEVQNGGQTKSTSVTLRGKVTPNREVQIYDNNTLKNTVRAVGDTWSTILAVGLGGHSVKVRAVSTGQESNTRGFTVISPIPPLLFNTNPVTLSGRIYLIPASPHVLPAFGQGTSVHHQASGGQPGYTYYSNNTAVAVVDASGLVTVRGNGTATISVRDQTAQTKSYNVTVTGVIHCYGFGKDTWPTINNILASNGTRMPSRQELREIRAFYGNRWPGANDYYWSADSAGGFPARYHMVNIISGYEAHVQYYGKYHGVGIR